MKVNRARLIRRELGATRALGKVDPPGPGPTRSRADVQDLSYLQFLISSLTLLKRPDY